MAAFQVELQLTGLKVKIKGRRDDVRQLSENLGHQLSGLITPAARMIEHKDEAKGVNAYVAQTIDHDQILNGGKGAKRSPRGKTGRASAGEVIQLSHDMGKWGTPRQAWSTADKCIWLLFVVNQETGKTELPGPTLAATFNHHFKEAKKIRASNISRDLRKQKGPNGALVGENMDANPTSWYLTQEGQKRAAQLVEEAKGIETNKPQAT